MCSSLKSGLCALISISPTSGTVHGAVATCAVPRYGTGSGSDLVLSVRAPHDGQVATAHCTVPGYLPLYVPYQGINQLNSLRSQARAKLQFRSTVACESPSASAVSGIDNPPKKRNSTIRLCCGLVFAKRLSASSSANSSTSGPGSTRPISSTALSEICNASPPRFSACRALA